MILGYKTRTIHIKKKETEWQMKKAITSVYSFPVLNCHTASKENERAEDTRKVRICRGRERRREYGNGEDKEKIIPNSILYVKTLQNLSLIRLCFHLFLIFPFNFFNSDISYKLHDIDKNRRKTHQLVWSETLLRLTIITALMSFFSSFFREFSFILF